MTRESQSRSLRKEVPAFHIGKPFNPYKLFTGIHIPEALVRYRGVSLGAKVVYGRLARYAGENGDCYPAIPTLASEVGIGATQARTYVHELRDQGFIVIEERSGTSASYRFIFHQAFAGEIGQTRKAPPLRKTGGVPLRKTEPPPLRKTGDEENHHQDSQRKESQVKESQVPASNRKVKTQKPLASHSVDDEKKPHEAIVYGSPWEELRAEFQKASGGTQMACLDERWLKEQMEVRCITAEALVEVVHENPLSGFKSPMAGLKWLVKKFQTKTQSVMDLESSALSPPVEAPRCENCWNSGRIVETIQGKSRPRVTDQYCDCRMGKELEAVEKRKTKSTPCVTTEPSWIPGVADRKVGEHHVAK